MDQTIANLLIAIYYTENGAENALEELRSAGKQELDSIHAAIAVTKDKNSGLHYKDVGMTPEKGALGGVVLGGILGILTGGVGIVLGGLGALIGGLVGEKKREERIASAEINQVITTLAPGSSALILVTKPAHRETLAHSFGQSGAEVITAEIPRELAEKLEDHRSEAYALWRDKIGE